MDGAQRLAQAVRARRQDLAMTPSRFSAFAGISETTLRKIESGDDTDPHEETLFAIDRAAGVPNGTCARILDGGLDGFPPPPNADQLELARRIASLPKPDSELLSQLLRRLGA